PHRRRLVERQQVGRRLVLLPVVLPGIVHLLTSFDVVGPGWVVGVLVASMRVAGIPYAVCALIGLALLWNRPISDYVRYAIRAPLMFVPLFLVVVSRVLGADRGPWDFVDATVSSFCVSVPIGYAYVGV